MTSSVLMDKVNGKFIYVHSDGNTHYKAYLKPDNTTTELARNLENGTAEAGASAEVLVSAPEAAAAEPAPAETEPDDVKTDGKHTIEDMQPKPSRRPEQRRRKACEKKYTQTGTGKWTRNTAIAAYHFEGEKLKEFDDFEAAFAYEESCRINGAGGRHAAYTSKPESNIPRKQLHLFKHAKHVIYKDGNKTRVLVEGLVEEIHELFDTQAKDELTAAEHFAQFKKKKAAAKLAQTTEKAMKDKKKAEDVTKRELAKRKREESLERALKNGPRVLAVAGFVEGDSASTMMAEKKKRLKELEQVYNEAIAIQKKKEKALRNKSKEEGGHFPGTGHQEADPRSSNMEVDIPSQQLLPVVARKKGNKRKMPPSVSASPSTVQVINAV